MIDDKLRVAALTKIKEAQTQVLQALVQLNAGTMQELGEQHVMWKAKHQGLAQAAAIIEEAYAELMGEAKPEQRQETRSIY